MQMSPQPWQISHTFTISLHVTLCLFWDTLSFVPRQDHQLNISFPKSRLPHSNSSLSSLFGLFFEIRHKNCFSFLHSLMWHFSTVRHQPNFRHTSRSPLSSFTAAGRYLMQQTFLSSHFLLLSFCIGNSLFIGIAQNKKHPFAFVKHYHLMLWLWF